MKIWLTWWEGADQTLPVPRYGSLEAAGADICANLAAPDRASGIEIAPHARSLIPTGLAMAIPQGFEVQLRPRSGLALKHGLTLLNTPGTIDSDYRGHVQVLLINLGTETFCVEHGMRIAQAVVAPVHQAHWQIGDTLDETMRGTGGFGSTGIGVK